MYESIFPFRNHIQCIQYRKESVLPFHQISFNPKEKVVVLPAMLPYISRRALFAGCPSSASP